MDAELQDMRGLALRFDARRLFHEAMDEWRRGEREERPIDPEMTHGLAPLTAPERERLFGWVRRRMESADEKVRGARADIDARRSAKGMPPTKNISASRESLALSIAIELDLAPWDTKAELDDEDLAPARALCEAAGWPQTGGEHG